MDATGLITTTYAKTLWNPFSEAIDEYRLIAPGDRIAVCLSGGKDSSLMALLLAQYQKIHPDLFSLELISMDPGFSPEIRRQNRENWEALGLVPQVFSTNVFERLESIPKRPCSMCAKMRRGWLYTKAKELGCNKIALGHHFTDIITSTLLSVLYGGQIQTMLPKVDSEHFDGMQLIRPMARIKEETILAWVEDTGLTFPNCACTFAKRSEGEEGASKRALVRDLIRKLSEENPQIPANIYNALKDVKVTEVFGYTDSKGHHDNF